MSAIRPFEFVTPGRLIDGELELILADTSRANPRRHYVPSYGFQMTHADSGDSMGRLSVRIGDIDMITQYAGHIGYNVTPRFRGHHYAARSCKLVVPVLRHHGINPVWITCNPDNLPSRRTCELLGATLVNVVKLPETTEMYRDGDRYKCRYRWELEVAGDE